MRRIAFALAFLISGIAAALAQNVTVIGPITPGDIPQFNSQTVIKDSGVPGGSALFANPTAAVGLTAVNGSALTAMRSDAAPPLSASVQSALTQTNNQLLIGTGAFGFASIVLGGDCTFTSPNITCTKVNGVSYGSNPSTDTVPVVTAANTTNYTAVPNCTTGVLQYSTATHLFSCGATGSGSVTSVTIAGGTGIGVSGTCTITTSGTCTVALSAARQTLPTTQHFTTGSGTYTTPANVLWIEVQIVGGGGGGGAAQTNDGTGGGNTCWNTTGAACTTPVYQAGGGGAGLHGSASATGGAGGVIAGSGSCTRSFPGGSGTGGFNGTGSLGSGAGGNSFYGGGGGGGINVAGIAGATNTGSGGGGGEQSSTGTGGSGGGAGAYCYVIINTPAATYTYAVGTNGSGGAAGGQAGGNGAVGDIFVIEHYGSWLIAVLPAWRRRRRAANDNEKVRLPALPEAG